MQLEEQTTLHKVSLLPNLPIPTTYTTTLPACTTSLCLVANTLHSRISYRSYRIHRTTIVIVVLKLVANSRSILHLVPAGF